MASASVFVVGTDEQRKHRLVRELEDAGFETKAGMPSSTRSGRDEHGPGRCIVIDTVSAVSFSREAVQTLVGGLPTFPVVAVCAPNAAERVAEAFRGGAFDVLIDPFDVATMKHIVGCALEESQVREEDSRFTQDVETRLSKLSRGELDVLECVLDGTANKIAAARLGIGLRTVEARRARVLDKMSAGSVPKLVAMITKHRQSSRDGARRRTGFEDGFDGASASPPPSP